MAKIATPQPGNQVTQDEYIVKAQRAQQTVDGLKTAIAALESVVSDPEHRGMVGALNQCKVRLEVADGNLQSWHEYAARHQFAGDVPAGQVAP